MNRHKVKDIARVRVRSYLNIRNVSKELVWLKATRTHEEMRDILELPEQLGWFDEGIPQLKDIRAIVDTPKFHKLPILKERNLEKKDIDNVRLFIRGKITDIPLMRKEYEKVDLQMAQESIPCFGTDYLKCKLRTTCPLSKLCKQEASKLRAQDKMGTDTKYIQLRENETENTPKLRVDESLEKASQEEIDRWKESDKLQYYRYLRHMVFTEQELLALESAEYYENRVKGIMKSPFFTVLGRKGDITLHKNWKAFLRIGEKVIQCKCSVKQYMEAQFHFSRSRTGYPPLNSLGSDNAAKRYEQYITEVIKKSGTKMVEVWQAKDKVYKMEQSLQEMWERVHTEFPTLFPSKDFYLIHGKETGLGRTNHFTEDYLREKYPGELYHEVMNNYLRIVEVMREKLPKVYLTDMNRPALYTDIYSQ